jgi:hypothetical protein
MVLFSCTGWRSFSDMNSAKTTMAIGVTPIFTRTGRERRSGRCSARQSHGKTPFANKSVLSARDSGQRNYSSRSICDRLRYPLEINHLGD